MGSTSQPISLPLTGVDKSQRHSEQSVDNMLNLRPEDGVLVQTDLVKTELTLPLVDALSEGQIQILAPVVNAGLLTPAPRYLAVGGRTIRTISTDVNHSTIEVPPLLLRTRIDASVIGTVQGEVLLAKVTSTAYVSGRTSYELQIISATQFDFSIDGGAATTYTIASEVSVLDGLTVFFTTLEGYSTSATFWEWRFLVHDDSAASNYWRSNVIPYNQNYYFSWFGDILHYHSNKIREVGYAKLKGRQVVSFQEHLVVSHYAVAVANPGTGIYDQNSDFTDFEDQYITVAWTSLNNPDEFYANPATGNEAGTYKLYSTDFEDKERLGVTGMGVIRDSLYIYRTGAIYIMRYVGLPIVMNTRQIFSVGNIFPNGLIQTPFGHFFVGSDSFYTFDGNAPRSIGRGVYKQFKSELEAEGTALYNETWGFYDEEKQEVAWVYQTAVEDTFQSRKVAYNITTGLWYFQNLPRVYCAATNVLDRDKQLYGGDDNDILADVSADEDIPLFDQVKTAVESDWTLPYIEWPWSSLRDPTHVKEIQKAYVDYNQAHTKNAKFFIKHGIREDDNLPWKELPEHEDSGTFYGQDLSGRKFKAKLVFDDGAKAVRNLEINDVTLDVFGLRKEIEG